ncbi:Gag-pol protein [Camponotus japonicus]
MQQLWQVKLDWDDKLPSSLLEQWNTIKTSLASIDNLQIDRWIQRGADSINCELHGFSDAANAAYAAAVYIRLTSLSGQITSMLLIGKAKAAPVKPLTIPRLELSAALLLARLMEFVCTSLNLAKAPCYCWTDSSVVLAWVTQHPSKWKTFVANRVTDIQSRIPFASWKHVSTGENPADCASRGIHGQQLASHDLWWQGPSWLRLPESEWPSATDQSFCETSLEKVTHAHTHHVESVEPWDLATRYSSWPKLLRITAYIIRYTSRIRRLNDPHVGINESPSTLSTDEFQRARKFWLTRIQDELFAPEKKALSQQQSISSKSAILSLNPFLDEEKLIRVGGRLAHAPFSKQRKHPIILASHPLVELIIRHAHLRSMHAGTQLTLATLRHEF